MPTMPTMPPSATTVRAPETPTSPASRAGRAGAFMRLLRPIQWVKNGLLFVPLILSHQVRDGERLTHVVIAFTAFCFGASAAYVLNDWRDAAEDQRHPIKRRRPIASGQVPAAAAPVLAGILLAGSFALAAPLLDGRFVLLLAVYFALTVAYSFYLKRKLLVDVFVLAGLYTLRIMAGGAAAAVVVSPWLAAFAIFFFLSLAFAKRYAELRDLVDQADGPTHSRSYRRSDLGVIESVGPASGYMAVLVMALYINSDAVTKLYRAPWLLWLLCPLVLYWITRVWFFAQRGALSEDPVTFAVKDHVTWIAVAMGAMILASATLVQT